MDEQLLKYIYGELPEHEQAELIYRAKNDENLKKELIHLQNINAISKTFPHPLDREEGLRKYRLFNSKVIQLKRKTLLVNVLKYAAIVLIIITSTIISTIFFYERGEEAEMNTLYVPAGQRAQITLQDGTEVWLNAQSTLKYPSHFSKKSRNVEVSGEAFFDVAKKSKPFIVYTNGLKLQVLGTTFNVYSYPEVGYIQTDLIEGSLKILDNNNNIALLKSNEKLIYRENNMSVSRISDPDHILWKEGIYSFQNERLIDIIEKLQLYYDVEIIVEDPEIFNMQYTGKFRQRDGIIEILRIIKKIQTFKIIKDTDTNIITIKR